MRSYLRDHQRSAPQLLIARQIRHAAEQMIEARCEGVLDSQVFRHVLLPLQERLRGVCFWTIDDLIRDLTRRKIHV